MDKLANVYVRLNQPHNLSKLILSRIVLLLAAADPVAAQAEYDRQLDAPGFSSAPEAEAAEDLLVAYAELNPESVKKVVDKNVFNYLDNAITRVAKGLVNAVATGTSIGSANANESATRGVVASTSNRGGQVLDLPAGFKAVGGGGYGSSSANADADAVSATATRVAARAQEKDGSARSALFARSAAATKAEEGSEYGGAVTRAPAPAPAPAETAEEDEEFDMDAAIKELDMGEEEGGNEGNHSEQKEEEDLGLL
jgi:hypothetical protein